MATNIPSSLENGLLQQPAKAISSQMESSDDSEIAVKQRPGAADPVQPDREPL
jgi:hypothetical protein